MGRDYRNDEWLGYRVGTWRMNAISDNRAESLVFVVAYRHGNAVRNRSSPYSIGIYSSIHVSSAAGAETIRQVSDGGKVERGIQQAPRGLSSDPHGTVRLCCKE